MEKILLSNMNTGSIIGDSYNRIFYAGQNTITPSSGTGLPSNPNLTLSPYEPSSANIVNVTDEQVFTIGGDFTITGKELRLCLKVMLKTLKTEYPEELI